MLCTKERTAMTSIPADAATGPTPIPISPRTRTIILISLVIASVLLLRAMPSVVGIFLGGSIIALLFSFPVRLLARYMPRGLAILLTILAANLLIILALVVFVPRLVEQLSALLDALPQYMADLESSVNSLLQPLRESGVLPAHSGEYANSLQEGLLALGQTLVAGALAGILGFFSGAIGGLVHTFIALMVALYLMLDIQRIRENVVRLAPARYRPDVSELWARLGGAVSRYLGGLSFSMAEQGTLVFLGSWLLGIPYPLVLGVWFGLTAVVPYLGAWLGAIPLVLIALLSGGIVKGLLALGLTFLVNGFDSNIVQPRVQGNALRVHPIVVMLTVIGGSELIGPLGAVIGLPIVGMLKVIFDFFIDRLVVQPAAVPVVITVPGRTTGDPATPEGEPAHFPPPAAATAERW
jgi:predicted PurR-regulated permease PerM